MRRRQCRICNDWWDERNDGVVIKKEPTTGDLPGLKGVKLPITLYTVRCKKCGRTWTYRKKRK